MYKQYQQSDPFNYHIQYIHYAPYGELIENISPYAYCALNPVKYVDPDGRKIVVGSWLGRTLAKLGFNNFEAKVMAQLQELKDLDSELNKMITKIEKMSEK